MKERQVTKSEWDEPMNDPEPPVREGSVAQLLLDLQAAALEVNAMREGRVKGKSLKKFLDEF